MAAKLFEKQAVIELLKSQGYYIVEPTLEEILLSEVNPWLTTITAQSKHTRNLKLSDELIRYLLRRNLVVIQKPVYQYGCGNDDDPSIPCPCDCTDCYNGIRTIKHWDITFAPVDIFHIKK